MIDWGNPKSMVSEYFSVRECLWLPSWGRMALDSELSDEIRNNLVILFKQMDHIRDFFTAPIIVHCAFRAPAYSVLVGGSSTDVHVKGEAVDFIVEGFEGSLACNQVKQLLIPSLSALNMRIENNPDSQYIHADIHPPGITGRFFTP